MVKITWNMVEYKEGVFTLRSKSPRFHQIISNCAVAKSINTSTKAKTYKALWDTGASGTSISSKVVYELGLQQTGLHTVNHAGGKMTTRSFHISLFLPTLCRIDSLEVEEVSMNGVDVIIGMDVISLCDFAITREGDHCVFSLRTPSLKTIDFTIDSDT